MTQLVLVHGRGQEDLDATVLKAQWLRALTAGLGDVPLPVAEQQVRFPYYGDTLVDMAGGLSAAQAARVVVRGDPGEDERRLVAEVLQEVAEQVGVTDEAVRAEAGQEAVERGPQNWPWVLALLRAIDSHVPHASAGSIALATADVYHYLTNAAVRETIDEGLVEAFSRDEPSVVVAHSLGTVVAYRLLRREGAQRGWRVPVLITLGSPLGVTAIRKLLAAHDTLRVPACVDAWHNVYDPRDVVSLYPLSGGRFPVPDDGPRIVDRTVENTTPNRHGIDGYLGEPTVARTVHDALVGAATG